MADGGPASMNFGSGGITVRPERPEDADAIDEVVAAAFLAEFGTATEVDLVRSMRARGELIPDLTLVAELDDSLDDGHGGGGRIVGHIALSEVTLDGRPARGLGLGPVAAAPDVQRRGVGSLLITTALDRAEQRGWHFVVLLGHPSYYPRFGFTPAAEFGITGDYGDGDAWMVRPLGDRVVPSGHVRYCSSFHE